MGKQPVTFDRVTLGRFFRTVKYFFTSEVRWRARGLFALLIVFALSVNGLNVINSYVGRDFMTAISNRDQTGFVREAILFVALLVASTVIAVFYRFTEDRLGLFWREWLTRRVTRLYVADRTYLNLQESATIENPDQRIADDIRVFTATSLSFTLMLMNGILAALSFSGVLWTISPLLFGITIGYALLGTVTTIYLGRPLIGLNYRQSDQEAAFRSDLIHVRENSESIALLQHEDRLTVRLLRRIDGFADNFRRIISINRNLGFFTTGFNYLTQIIPALVVARLFIRGRVEFGVIPQSAVAFTQLLGAFSLIVNQFQSISSFASVIARLSELVGTVEKGSPSAHKPVTVIGADARIAYEGLRLFSPEGDREVLQNLTAENRAGRGCWSSGRTKLPESRYFGLPLASGSPGPGCSSARRRTISSFYPSAPTCHRGRFGIFSFALTRSRSSPTFRSRIHCIIQVWAPSRYGGLDTEHNWSAILSLGEQQLLALTRLIFARPAFAMLDRVTASLKPAQVREALRRLDESSITYITFAEDAESVDMYDALLEIDGDGGWTWNRTRYPTSAALT
ncbi:ABC transporter ATP-binding protein/permease [Acidobacterium sp. S8]|uniref:ABC transporter ATP-binding protein/permease n=1 Tax=Acidobacterium sp. S8 TaxID=1641854 RepID=UPI001C208348|nr:SbmA/BacA-like family transporter [Acidobacterium sp. S8]